MAGPAIARLSMLHSLPKFLDDAGVDCGRIFRSVGIGDLRAIEARAPVHRAQICAALEFSARAVGRPSIGLDLGSATDALRLGVSGRALLQGRTLMDALHDHAQLLPTMHQDVDCALTVVGNTAIWSHEMKGGPAASGWVLYEGAAAFLLKSMEQFIGGPVPVRAVELPHVCRGRLADYEDFFGAPVIFGSGRVSRIHFDASCLSQAAGLSGRPHFDIKLVSVARCRDELTTFTAPDDLLADWLDAIIDAHLSSGELNLPLVARILGVPKRTLQRRLSASGRVFEDIVDGLRQQKALAMCDGAASSVTTIAMDLGYSDTAHFIRAFKRWMGMTPTQYMSRRDVN